MYIANVPRERSWHARGMIQGMQLPPCVVATMCHTMYNTKDSRGQYGVYCIDDTHSRYKEK